MKRSYFSVVVLALVLAFLYVPILLVVVYGFIPNGISMSFFDSAGRFTGFTGRWYAMIFTGNMRLDALMQSFWLSLVVAGLATLISCAIGTTSALALHKWRGRLQSIHHALVYTPLIMPDILIGISLLMLFVACSVDCGFWTILIAHVTFCVSYVVMTILARLQDFDDRLIEAAYAQATAPLLTVTNIGDMGGFSSELAHVLLTDNAVQTRLLENIVALINAKSYYGLNINFEYVYPFDRDAYSAFVARAAERLHPLGCQVSTAIAPKESADQQGILYTAHDYKAHGQYADTVILMT